MKMLVRILLLWQVDSWFWCLNLVVWVLLIRKVYSLSSRTFMFDYNWKKYQFMTNMVNWYRFLKNTFLFIQLLLLHVETFGVYTHFIRYQESFESIPNTLWPSFGIIIENTSIHVQIYAIVSANIYIFFNLPVTFLL